MVPHLRSNQKSVKLERIGSINLINSTNANQTINNMGSYSQSNPACNVKKFGQRQVFESNVTDHADAELLNVKNNNTDVLYLKEPLRKEDKNMPVQNVKRNDTIMNIPRKKFKNFEAILSLSSDSDLSDMSSEYSESDSPDQFDHQHSTQETKFARKWDKWLRLNSIDIEEIGKINGPTTSWSSDSLHKKKTKQRKVAKISKNSSKHSEMSPIKKKLNTTPLDTPPLNLIEQPNLTETALETNLLIQGSSNTCLAPDQSKKIDIMDDLIIKSPSLATQNAATNYSEHTTAMTSADDLNKAQEFVIVYQDTCNSTSHVNSMNYAPSNSSTSNVIQDFTRHNNASTNNINRQPVFLNEIGAVDNRPQNYELLDTSYTYVPSNSIVHISQKIEKTQESLKEVIETLNYVVQAQEKLQNVQNEIKMELQNMKSQNLAYENREKWLAENGIILPMKSKEEFTKFCTLLDQSPESRKILEISVHFAINSKRSLTKNISSVIRKYLVCELANQFTAIRYVKGKDVLANTSFYKHLIKNFLEKSSNGLIFPGLTEMDFNRALGEVLCNVKDWKRMKTASI